MSDFNFFLNIDDCLNISNFDMFFYKLQSERKFYVVDTTFQDELGEKSLRNALKGVKNYIGQSSFPIQDYRLIFGIRQPYQKTSKWKDTVLFRLLKIYYGLHDAQIYVKTKDQTDKNVTVILLYDVENTYDEREIPDEITDNTRDIPSLMEYLGVDWDKDILPDEKSIADKMLGACTKTRKRGGEKVDPITRKFVKEYYDWMTGNALDKTETSITVTADYNNQGYSPSKFKKESRIFNKVYNLNTFIDRYIGQYCVFTKAVSSDARAHRLALLSIVDYITTGLITDERKEYTNENLKQQARNNWSAAKNDKEIEFKYGIMMCLYEKRMQSRLIEMEKWTQSIAYAPPTEVSIPKTISEELISGSFEETIKSCLDNVRMYGLSSSRDNAGVWETAEQELKKLSGVMEQSLEDYSERLSVRYKQELDHRKMEKKQRTSNTDIYSIEGIEEKLREVSLKKEELLENLAMQHMNPTIRYQDQLNVDSAIQECGQIMRFYLNRSKHITLLNFFQTLIIACGIVLLHHFILQESLLENQWNVLAFGAYVGVSLVLCLISLGFPGFHYRRLMKKALNNLDNDLETYMHGYIERAKNFEEYINIINALDVMNVYAEELEEMKKCTQMENRMMLWHKERIEGHINKCAFFQLIYEMLPEEQAKETHSVELDLHSDVIHNPFYWPQES